MAQDLSRQEPELNSLRKEIPQLLRERQNTPGQGPDPIQENVEELVREVRIVLKSLRKSFKTCLCCFNNLLGKTLIQEAGKGSHTTGGHVL